MNAHIINQNLIIPHGKKTFAQLALLQPHNIALFNPSHKNIVVSTNQIGTTLTPSSPEITCLGSINRMVIGPLTVINITYGGNQILKFQNGSLEHDLVFENMGNIFSQLISLTVSNFALYTLTNTSTTSQDIISGNVLISTVTTPNNYITPQTATMINATDITNFVLGPYTAVYVGSSALYNSGNQTLYYSGVTGISGRIIPMTASPLNSGHAKFYSDCNYSKFNFAKSANQNQTAVANNIASMIVAPYTKITLISSQNSNKIFENNTLTEAYHSLCDNQFHNTITSIRVEFSASYVGYGFVSLDQFNFQPSTYNQGCATTIISSPVSASPVSASYEIVAANTVPLAYIERVANTTPSYYGTASVPDYSYVHETDIHFKPDPSYDHAVEPNGISLDNTIEGFGEKNYNNDCYKNIGKIILWIILILLVIALIYILYTNNKNLKS